MNIGMVLDAPYPPDVRVENEATQLIKNGHQVFLFALNFGNYPEKELLNGITIVRYKFPKYLYNKLAPLAYTFPFYHSLISKKFSDFVNRNKINVVHIHDMVVAKTVFNNNFVKRLPVVLDLHENRPEIMKTYSHITNGIGKCLISIKRWKSAEEEFIKRSNFVIVVTELAKKDYVERYGVRCDKIKVFSNFINLEEFMNCPIKKEIASRFTDDFVLLYIGATGIRRGLDTAIKAVALLKDKIQNIRLVIVGNSRDDAFLLKLANEYNVSNNVSFEGWRNSDEFPSYLINSNVCVSPLVRNKHHDTTYANKLFQYMAYSKPLLVSDCQAQAELVTQENCGLVHVASNEHDLKDKILALYENKLLCKELGENGFDAVKNKYNSNLAGKSLINLYEDIERVSKANG